jgi:hypothetical protein
MAFAKTSDWFSRVLNLAKDWTEMAKLATPISVATMTRRRLY